MHSYACVSLIGLATDFLPRLSGAAVAPWRSSIRLEAPRSPLGSSSKALSAAARFSDGFCHLCDAAFASLCSRACCASPVDLALRASAGPEAEALLDFALRVARVAMVPSLFVEPLGALAAMPKAFLAVSGSAPLSARPSTCDCTLLREARLSMSA